MNCPRCQAPNENDAKFCKQCGMGLFYNPANWRPPAQESGQTINFLMALVAIDYLIGLCWLALQKVIFPFLMRRSSFSDGNFYKYFGWATDVLMLGVLIIFLALTKNDKVRVFLVIILVVKIILVIGYRLFNNY